MQSYLALQRFQWIRDVSVRSSKVKHSFFREFRPEDKSVKYFGIAAWAGGQQWSIWQSSFQCRPESAELFVIDDRTGDTWRCFVLFFLPHGNTNYEPRMEKRKWFCIAMPLPTLQESTSKQTRLLSESHVDNCLSGAITCIHYPLFYY